LQYLRQRQVRAKIKEENRHPEEGIVRRLVPGIQAYVSLISLV
jgi:hypothetical protein